MNLWQLTESNARLAADSLKARVDLLNPAHGLYNLTWCNAPITGNLLGVTVAEDQAASRPLATAGLDCFVRGNDLVANYPECAAQPFTLHMYWRVVERSATGVVIDAIVSLQTSLWECFPKALLTTNLPGGEVLSISNDYSLPVVISGDVTSTSPHSVLVRCADMPWSYVEMTHPTDLGSWRAMTVDGTQLTRELGGNFQEKGVIRRLRVRGAFVPRAGDEQAARQLLANFAASEPPLTA